MRSALFHRVLLPAVFALLWWTLPVSRAVAEQARLSISGYDPVAYFTDHRPVPGNSEFELLWHELRWRFANEAHRRLFRSDPDRYAPQYDGYCALGAVLGTKDTIDPTAWAIVDGKLYLTHSQHLLQKWRENEAANIKRGERSWAATKKLPAPQIVGPPCAASPPTTLVALRGGVHWVVVGEQSARDDDGNIVGKGDLRAQIARVGENIAACLTAAGAAPKDIVKTLAFVRDPAAFKKQGDLRRRYFGPASAKHLTIPDKDLSSPDALLQVMAVATVKQAPSDRH